MAHSPENHVSDSDLCHLSEIRNQIKADSRSGTFHHHRVDRKYDHDQKQCCHHELGYFFDTFLDSKCTYTESNDTDQNRPKCHKRHISKHITKSSRYRLHIRTYEISTEASDTIIQHPSTNRSIEHHQKIASNDTDPFCNMPLCSLGFQCLICGGNAVSARTSDTKFTDHNRNSHDQKEYQIYQNKCSSTELSTHIWEFPHISDANGTPCGYKDEAQS